MSYSPPTVGRTSPVVRIKTSDGFLEIPEGSIYWKFDERHDAEASSRPTLLLIHAAVADHTLWDEQVEYLVSKDWNCLRLDMFGFGQSKPNQNYLHSEPRVPFNYVEQIDSLLQTVLGPNSSVIVIGLSMGGGLALSYTLAYSEKVVGLAIIAGGVEGFEHSSDPNEDALEQHCESLIQIGDIRGAAQMKVRYWGDGPLQEPGRLPDDLVDRMYKWNIDIVGREYTKSGGTALASVKEDPPAIARLHNVHVPTAVAWGTFDESYTTEAMKYIANHVAEASSKEFNTAHMVNLEQPDEVNEWLNEWLESNFDTEEGYSVRSASRATSRTS